jgi:SAM-dependent methyltransferase
MQLTTAPAERGDDRYALGHSSEEYDRLRRQARIWEAATGRLLDHVGLAPGARCLDAGCGPGETMRLMAQRVGPAGVVVGIDADSALGEMTLSELHAAGHGCCRFVARDLTDDGPIPGAPYDLVYARLLLFHLPERAAVLARLWDAVAPGGHLVVQDYDLRAVGVLPPLDSVAEIMRVLVAAFVERGCDVHAGANLANVFVQAGVGDPDAGDVAGRVEPLATGRAILEETFCSVLPVALERGITTETDAVATLAALDADATGHPDRPMLWPLLIGAWKRKDRT